MSAVELYQLNNETKNLEGASWMTPSPNQDFPDNSVFCDFNYGEVVLVIRGILDAQTTPGKYHRKWHRAYISIEKTWHYPTSYEFLTGSITSFAWIPSSNGEIVENAVVGGRTANGEPLFIGRFYYDKWNVRTLVPGHVQPSLKKCVITWGESRDSVWESSHYEILIGIPPGEKVPVSGQPAKLWSEKSHNSSLIAQVHQNSRNEQESTEPEFPSISIPIFLVVFFLLIVIMEYAI